VTQILTTVAGYARVELVIPSHSMSQPVRTMCPSTKIFVDDHVARGGHGSDE